MDHPEGRRFDVSVGGRRGATYGTAQRTPENGTRNKREREQR
jgi:hypothetical protein